MILRKISIFLTLLIWPLSLFLSNSFGDILDNRQTIFIKDYEAQQKVIRDTQLYQSIFLARVFHNKARIVLDKFTDNFFALTDPNNYFFGFAPRQIVGNQNLVKFPFLSLFFFLIAIYYFKDSKSNRLIAILIVTFVVLLSCLKNFDKSDFVLWVPLSLLIVNGINIVSKLKHSQLLFLVYLLFSITELIRIIVVNSI